jgi:NSS family neurotransmitter:Na+ symporter
LQTYKLQSFILLKKYMAGINGLQRQGFASKFGVIAATAGSAVGLGNIWRFPYVTGTNGGGAFIFIYLIFVIVIVVNVMLCEFIIGRRAQKNPVGAFKKLAPGKHWHFVGFMGVVAAFVILAFYSTVAGWTMEYVFKSITNAFSNKNPSELSSMFDTFKSGNILPVFWQLLFMGLTVWIIISGVQKGIEKYSKILMPLLLIIIVILDVRAVTLHGAGKGLAFLFNPDFSEVTGNTILQALGQAFFSLSVGMGTLITYGSYINKKENLANTAVTVAGIDTLIAILAGIAIFPAVFAFGIEPSAGPGLVFITLPNIFQQMTGGYIFSLLFFVLLLVAALTSSISVLEVVVVYFVEELKMVRRKATLVAGVLVSILGIFCSLSWGAMSGISFFGKNIFDLLDFSASNVFLPIGGLFIVLFIGWFYKKEFTRQELSNNGKFKIRYFPVFIFLVKFIAPVAIAIIFLNGIGLLKF